MMSSVVYDMDNYDMDNCFHMVQFCDKDSLGSGCTCKIA